MGAKIPELSRTFQEAWEPCKEFHSEYTAELVGCPEMEFGLVTRKQAVNTISGEEKSFQSWLAA